MGGGNFMSRVVSYVVNELVVDTLANNREFQRFAVRTSRKMKDLSNRALQKSQELTEKIEDFAKNLESSKNR